MLKCREDLKSKFKNEFQLYATKFTSDNDEDVK